jgi:microcin C transport system permease protein
MRAYIIRRLLLMVPTVLGITIVCFALIQMVPGGPVEEFISRTQAAAAQSGGAVDASKTVMTPEELENIKRHFGFDKPPVERYISWLKNVFSFNLGESFTYNEPVWDVISSRFPISLLFGLTSFLLTYLICIPLGILKAIRNGSRFDTWSSVAIFSGYVIPGYALGILLIIFFAGGSYFDWFPLGSLFSENHESLSFFGKVKDLAHHAFLPMICYMIGEFAFLTMMVKNSMLEEISRDYMRAALARGNSFKRAVWKHALRNALIPVATRLSELFTLIFAGALLIEKVFDIDGMGQLYYNAIVNRDYNVVMGVILLSSILALLGRLFSDILYVMVDPRIKFK